MKKVINRFSGKEDTVHDEKKQLVWYDNAKRQAVYSAPAVGEGEWDEFFFTEWVEGDTVITDVEERLSTPSNTVRFAYAMVVEFNSSKNDASGEIWSRFVAYVKEHENEIFLKNGNFSKNIDVKRLVEVCGRR